MLYRKSGRFAVNCFLISVLLAAMPLTAQRGGKRDDKDKDTEKKQVTVPSTVPVAPVVKLKGPRAISVLQWQADEKGNATLKLLPVAIVDGDKYYDASLYQAQPVPMALGFGVVYEVFDRGKPFGYFTIEHPMQRAPGEDAAKQWFAFGGWDPLKVPVEEKMDFSKPTTTEVVRTLNITKPEVAGPRTASTSTVGTASTPQNNGTSQPTKTDSTSKAAPNASIDPNSLPPVIAGGDIGDLPAREPVDPNTLQKPKTVTTVYDENGKPLDAEAARKATEPSSKRKTDEGAHVDNGQPNAKPANADDDPDRPKFKKSAGPSSTNSGTIAVAKDDDPDRPRLKRGVVKSKEENEETTMPKAAIVPLPAIVQERGARLQVVSTYKFYETVAVSDVENAKAKQDFFYRWDDAERKRLESQMVKFAKIDVLAYLKRNIPRVSARIMSDDEVAPKLVRKNSTTATSKAKPPVPTKSTKNAKPSAVKSAETDPLADFADIQFQAFDLDHNNTPEIVFTARYVGTIDGKPSTAQTFVTIVARMNVDGNAHKLFSNVTDTTRFDIAPRMEIIDAIGPDRKNHGVLLFRRIHDGGSDFALYRVEEDKLTELFHGGSGG